MMQKPLLLLFGLFLAATLHAQQSAVAIRMAKKLNLCSEFVAKGVGFEDFPCDECQITYIPLKGAAEAPDLFFIEVQSAAHCGSGGCSGEVYALTKYGYRNQTGLFGYFERQIERPGQIPDLVYLHYDSGSHDFDQDGLGDRASIWMQYRWSEPQQKYLPYDLLRIETNGGSLPLAKLKQGLLKDWTQENLWTF
ncbi:hypothetical protein [Phaeodactylibacter luteus]|uniref:Uncharacterized protein n=1 Tax=Phaeodactylibacter luteus TaxID=1564516 RepID=A0A5C6RHA0_9BACT|nr:hypothetical protein [Phaeodactylibacter luteus]TXB61701.1 hypothetical protein FRY97_17815 [Phaeodactylibacter luteus]